MIKIILEYVYQEIIIEIIIWEKNIIQINENKGQNNSLGTIRISLSINNIQGNNNILRTGNNMWEINNISRNDNINLNFFLK